MVIRPNAARPAAWRSMVSACLLALAMSACSIDPAWTVSGAPMDRGAAATCDDDGFESPPVFVDGLAPHYPPLYAYDRKPGQASVEFDVLPDGSTAGVRATADSDKYFAGALVMAVKDWRYRPAARPGGGAVAAHCRTHFDFYAD